MDDRDIKTRLAGLTLDQFNLIQRVLTPADRAVILLNAASNQSDAGSDFLSRDQIRARLALEYWTQVQRSGLEYQREYGHCVRYFSVLARGDGLLRALAHVESGLLYKQTMMVDKASIMQLIISQICDDLLVSGVCEKLSASELLKMLMDADVEHLMLIQREAFEFLDWLWRFAKSVHFK